MRLALTYRITATTTVEYDAESPEIGRQEMTEALEGFLASIVHEHDRSYTTEVLSVEPIVDAPI